MVDFFDALTMDRCYRAAFSDERALEMLRAERGRAFDPDVVDAFIEHLPTFLSLRDLVNRRRPTFANLVDGVPALHTAPSPEEA